MNQPVIETPVMSIPREDTMRMALAARTLSGILRQLRERRGRSAWHDAENAARKAAVADRHEVTAFTRADAEEWNAADRDGRIRAERHPDTGMTIRMAPLSDGRFGVQAGWEDNHAEAVFGSEDLAHRVAEWLRDNASADAVEDLRRNAEDLYSDARQRRRQRRDQRHEARVAAAKQWLKETDPDRFDAWEKAAAQADPGDRPSETDLIGEWSTATGGRTETQFEQAREWVEANRPEWYANWDLMYLNADSSDARRNDENHLIRYWHAERNAEQAEQNRSNAGSEEQRPPTPLADRLRGWVPDRILDDPRWHVAEDQFAVLTAQGADTQLLIETVAAIDFDNGIRAPSGFAAWAMKEAAKKGAAARAHKRSEEDARRSVAEEWLLTADPDSPFDRARAAQLVGEIDDDFDAQLARKYPGILDGDADQARAQTAQHQSNGDDADAQARNTSARSSAVDEDAVFVVDADGVINVSFTEAPEPPTEQEAAESAAHSADAAREHEAADDEQHDTRRAASAAAQAPLTPPRQAKANTKTRRRTPPPAKPAATHTRNRGRAH
ncbi:hypothetical protein DFR70_12656 [Nocardia tenerifensis]|uniref:Uncharacterized protein n=1 Tax=Nocardia tenerifensis TaxID=228006 RepID=A0A318KAS1_9NOCA|nr:hypothetical protein [Nocardia tenerifensis]PXX53935.1 hypothetical protein DFR70_12656 [Nocardia tenerifensis]